MHKAKAFFFVCAGIFLLALSYHLGASTATAQSPSNPIVTSSNGTLVTANGDVYVQSGIIASTWAHWTLAGNVFSGGPTPARQETWGQVKVDHH